MFAATISPEDLEAAFKPVHALVDECKLHVDEDGITVTAVDPANVGMVDLDLPAEVFETYEADAHTIGVPLERFLDTVSLFTDNESPARIMLEEETRQLRLESGGLDCTLSLLDPDSIRKEPEIPDLQLTASVTVPGETFSRAVSACNMVADHLVLGADEGGDFYVNAEGDTDDVHVTMDEDEIIEIDTGDANSLFSIEYLRDMERAIPSEMPVTVEIGPEFPVIITYGVVDEQARIQYVLAPRITND